MSLETTLKRRANELGFPLVGICPAVSPPGFSHLQAWLRDGFAGEMDYLERRLDAYSHPAHILDGVRSIVMLAMDYASPNSRELTPGQGRVARYAWGAVDYHDLIHDRLKQLKQTVLEIVPAAQVRGVVDTAPLLEREFARLAGLGWIGKNTMLINKSHGSWFVLAALLTDQVLEYDNVHEAQHCGTCRACLEACPTQAFVEPYRLDARRCLSYLTIELREEVPDSLRHDLGDWLFGCDICQEVCPWNRHSEATDEPLLKPRNEMNPTDLVALFDLSEVDFRRMFRRTPLWRAKRRGILRNAALVLGNQRCTAATAALAAGVEDVEPIVRDACVWALQQLGTKSAQTALHSRLDRETDDQIIARIEAALDSGSP